MREEWREQAEAAISQGQGLNEFVAHCHPENRQKARKAYQLALLIHRPIVALGRKAKDGTIEVTDVLTASFPDMTNEEMANLSRKLDDWSKRFQRAKHS